MRKLLIVVLLLFSVNSYSQTFVPRVVFFGNTNDTLYLKVNISGQSTDSLYRYVAGNWVFAYKPKVKYLMPTQLIPNPASSSGDMVGSNNLSDVQSPAVARINLQLGTLATQDGDIDNYLLSSTASGLYQPIGNYASGVTNNGDNATNTQYQGLAAGKQDNISLTTTGTSGPASLIGATLNIPNYATGGGAGLGYTLSVQALTSSPADAATIYFCQLPKAPTTTANISKVYIRKAGTIKMAQIYCYSGTAGTAEAWVMSIRLNNTTDTQIASVSLGTSERIFTNSSLNIAVVAGDYIEIKCVNPTWATNPLTCIFGGYIYIE